MGESHVLENDFKTKGTVRLRSVREDDPTLDLSQAESLFAPSQLRLSFSELHPAKESGQEIRRHT